MVFFPCFLFLVGRTADSGHYVGWVKEGSQWCKSSIMSLYHHLVKFDDERVSPIPPEDIPKLEGGGDWHSAYICLYRSKSLAEV